MWHPFPPSPPEFAQPPARYMHSATTPLDIMYVDQDDVRGMCGAHPEGGYILGCVVPNEDGSPFTMILPSPKSWYGTKQQYRYLFNHELGHWNGWPADHPKE